MGLTLEELEVVLAVYRISGRVRRGVHEGASTDRAIRAESDKWCCVNHGRRKPPIGGPFRSAPSDTYEQAKAERRTSSWRKCIRSYPFRLGTPYGDGMP